MAYTRKVPAATVADRKSFASHFAMTVALVLWRCLLDFRRLPKGVLDEFFGKTFKFAPDGFQPSPQAIAVKRRLYADIRSLRDRVTGMWRPPVAQSRVSAVRNRVTAIRATGRQSGQRRRQRDGGSAKKASSDPDGGDGEPSRLLHPSFPPPRHHNNNRTRVTVLIDIEEVTA